MLQVFDDDMVAGGIIITVAATFSLLSLLLTLLHIFLSLVLPAYSQRMSSPQERKFIISPLGFYIICLFVSNVISAMGGVMEARWVNAGAIIQGPACSSQAFMFQLGNNATALWIGAISVSALRTFMFRARSLSRMATVLLILAIWAALIMFDALASTFFADPSGKFYYGIGILWCWITPSHRAARLLTQYVWMWFWSLVSVVCFLLIFLSLRGNITMKRDGLRRSVKWTKRAFDSCAPGRGDEQYGTLVGTVGKTMCWFPISYITLTLPISVSRVLETFGFHTPVYAFVSSAVCFLLLGIIFPILYFAICHSLKHSTAGVISPTTLYEDTLSAESFFNWKEKPLLPLNKDHSHPWTSTPSTRGRITPPSHHDITEASYSSSTMTSGEDEGKSTYRGSNAPPKRISVSFQIAPVGQSIHRPISSFSTITSSGTLVGPVQLTSVYDGKSVTESNRSQPTLPPAAVVASRHSRKPTVDLQLDLDKNVPLSYVLGLAYKHPDTDASAYTKPCAISSDLNALLLASQIPASPFGPPPPPRKIRGVPIPSVPVDVDESDQGSILSALPSTETFSPRDIQPIPHEESESMRTFSRGYESGFPMTPNMPSRNAALMRDTMRPFSGDYEDHLFTTADTPMSSDILPMSDPNIISPVSFQFQRLDPSVSLKPSISAVGRQYMDMSRRPSSRVVGNRQQSRSSTIMQGLSLIAQHSGDANTSYSATDRLSDY